MELPACENAENAMTPDWLYFDHAATAPLDPQIAEGMARIAREAPGHPDADHPAGRAALKVLQRARQDLAGHIGATSDKLVWTSGATESLNLALLGAMGRPPAPGARAPRIAISAVEHAAVRASAEWLAQERGYEIDVIPVDSWGRVQPDALVAALSPQTRLVALIWAHNELGTINDIAQLAPLVRAHAPRARLVIDGVQAFGKLPIDVRHLDIDALAFTAHKIHGPMHIGALYLRRPIQSIQRGGGQQAGQRGGTLSAPSAWGFAEAAVRMAADRDQVAQRGAQLWAQIQAALPQATLTGAPFGAGRLPQIVHFSLPGLPSGPLFNALANRGLCASAGSACAQGSFSPVLRALGRRPEEGAFLRLSPGRFTDEVQISEGVQRLKAAVDELQALGL